MTPDFFYSKGRVIASVNFIVKEMEDFDAYFSGITWQNYRIMEPLKLKALEKTVENILTALIEISGVIVVEEEKRVEDYATVIEQASLIVGLTSNEATQLARLARQRNRLAHRYLDFKWEAIKSYMDTRNSIKHFLQLTTIREEKKLQ
ncbi:MAG: DUF86 domain-containing protein [Deltaproteobacteria bacterium]|nr:DUF86 domain-containing protein [Deltaproteobacteria bacterium]